MVIKLPLIISLTFVSLAASAATDVADHCQQIIQNFALPAQKLRSKLASSTNLVNNYYNTLANLDKNSCLKLSKHKLKKLLLSPRNESTRRVAIILPLSGTHARFGQHLLQGLQLYLQQQRQDETPQLIIKDNQSNANLDEQLLAEALFGDSANMIIGGFQRHSANVLQTWAEQLRLPSIVLNSRIDSTNLKYTYFVYPQPQQLTDQLAAELKRRALKRVAILAPAQHSTDLFVRSMQTSLSKYSLTHRSTHRYTPESYESMRDKAEELFKTKSSYREEEYRELAQKEIERSKKNGEPFNPQNLVLSPLVDFDAIFLPDNFKQVRHMINIAKFLGVKSIPLVGHHEWRAAGLLSPQEPFLNGAFFADFIGDYRLLPQKLRPMQVEGYFAPADELEGIDFRYIGWRTADICFNYSERVNGSDFRKHFALDKFNNNRTSIWPTAIFSINSNQLILSKSQQVPTIHR